jgi:hypothetical protein
MLVKQETRLLEEVQQESAREFMEIGTSRSKILNFEHGGKTAVMSSLLTLPDSFQIEKAKIYKPASACSTMKVLLQPLRSKRSAHLMASSISREVS